MKHIIDARGLQCPLPVINTKNKIQEMNDGDRVEVIVDNEIAVQNLNKFATVRQYDITSSKTNDQEFHVIIIPNGEAEVEESIQCTTIPMGEDVYCISTNKMGVGSDELGTALMKAFIFSITKLDVLPKTIIFLNGGAHLTCEGSTSLEDIQLLESEGVQIMTCGTCLNFYGIQDTLKVGTVTNMYDIVDTMSRAGKVINI